MHEQLALPMLVPPPALPDYGPATDSDVRGLLPSQCIMRIYDRTAQDVETRDVWTWDRMLDGGRSYLVGRDVPMATFIRAHKSPLTPWQTKAFAWAMLNPGKRMEVRYQQPPLEYTIQREADHVVIGLPHQDWGGEKHWITQDGKTKILINVD